MALTEQDHEVIDGARERLAALASARLFERAQRLDAEGDWDAADRLRRRALELIGLGLVDFC